MREAGRLREKLPKVLGTFARAPAHYREQPEHRVSNTYRRPGLSGKHPNSFGNISATLAQLRLLEQTLCSLQLFERVQAQHERARLDVSSKARGKMGRPEEKTDAATVVFTKEPYRQPNAPSRM